MSPVSMLDFYNIEGQRENTKALCTVNVTPRGKVKTDKGTIESMIVQSSQPTAWLIHLRTYIRTHTVISAAMVVIMIQAMKPGPRSWSPPGGTCITIEAMTSMRMSVPGSHSWRFTDARSEVKGRQ